MSGLNIQRTGSPRDSIDRTCHPRDDSGDRQRLICLFLNNLPRSSSGVFSRDRIVITQNLRIPNDWYEAQSYHPYSLNTLSLDMVTEVTRILDSDSGEYKYLVQAELSVLRQDGNAIDEVRLGVATHEPWENQTVLQILTALRWRAKLYYNWHGENRSHAEQDVVHHELMRSFS